MASRTKIDFLRVKNLPTNRPLDNGHFYVVEKPNKEFLLYNITPDGEPNLIRGITDNQLDRLEQLTQPLLTKLSEDYSKSQIDDIVQGLVEDIDNIIVGSSAGFVKVNGTVLPSPETDNNYSIVGEGTYTKAGQAEVVVPSGHMGILNWDGSVWYLGSSVEMPSAAHLDELLDVSLDFENIPSVAASNNSNFTNFGRLTYANTDAVAGGHIIGLKIQVQTAGTLTVYKAKNVNSPLYTETLVEVLNLQVGVLNYPLDVQLEAGEVLTFGNSTDTGVYRYISGTTNPIGGGYYARNHSTGAWTEFNNNLNIGIDFAETNYKSQRLDDLDNGLSELEFGLSVLDEYFQMTIGSGEDYIPIASTLNANTSLTTNAYFYENFNILGGAHITKLRINCQTAGTVSILKATGVNTSYYSSSILDTFTLVVGLNEFDVDYNLDINETIGIGASTDTAYFNYRSGEPNPVGGGLFGRNYSTGDWATFNNDLCLGVVFENNTVQSGLINDINQRIDNLDNGLAGKKVSFIGDSITTYAGYITPGNAAYYPNTASGITNVELTWWKQFLNRTKATLASNDSWSGSRVSNTGSGSLQNRLNVISSDTDICFVFMGTNDFGNNIGLGEISFEQPYDVMQFTGAYQNAIEQLVTNYPTTKFYFITPTSRNLGGFPTKNSTYTLSEMCDRIIDLCKLYGVEWIDTRKLGITNQNRGEYTSDGLHLNVEGAKLFCDFIIRHI